MNGDGRVDLLNFLNFFLTRDRKEKRSAVRVTRALEAIREDALNKQVDKLKKQTIDRIDRWYLLGSLRLGLRGRSYSCVTHIDA